MTDFLEMSAVELADLIRRREASPVEIVEAHIEHAARVDAVINALAVERFDHALEEARRAEEALVSSAPDELGPLHGVPCTFKEMLSVEGMPVTAGSHYRRHVRATRDATTVSRIRRAGAIPIGLTNQSEIGMWIESVNSVYGRTNNPHDPTRSAGGSSGGEGAIVAAGGSPFGLGSDMGGSIRIPAMYCGIFGHKPGAGLVPRSGHFPADFSADGKTIEHAPSIMSIGPMARSARDLMPLLRLLAGPDGHDRQTVEVALSDPASVDLSELRVLLVEDPRIKLAGRASDEQRAATRRAAAYLAERGASIRYWEPPGLDAAVSIYLAHLGDEQSFSLREFTSPDGSSGVARELLRRLRGGGRHMAPILLIALGENLVGADPDAVVRGQVAGERLRRSFEEAMGEDGIVVMPTLPRTAPRHHGTLLRPFDLVYTAIFNALELPVTAVPLGVSEESGMPLGVQIVAPQHHDHLSIAAACAIEEATGGWRRPADPEHTERTGRGGWRGVLERTIARLSMS